MGKFKTLALLVAVGIAFFLGLNLQKKTIPEVEFKSDTVYSTRVIIETVTKYMPSPLLCYFLRDTTINGQSVTIEQKVYKDDDYTAYVSGVAPQLDSIQVFPKTIYQDRLINTEKKVPYPVKDTKRWGVGLSVGYGFSRDGPSPYIGIGVSYNIFKF